MWKIYKEGQGKWGRGLLAFAVALGALFGIASIHEGLPVMDRWTIPVVRWSIDYRFLIEAPVLIAALVFGAWIFSHPPAADFLIETENELKNKVTWPTKKEEVNASIVVVVTVVIIGIFILSIDALLQLIEGLVFKAS